MAKSKKKQKADDYGELKLEKPEEIQTGMDPHLQEIVLDTREERKIDQDLGTEDESGELQLDVIAKLGDPEVEVPGLNVVRTIGRIVTGTISPSDIEAVREHDNVVSLKRSTRLDTHLDDSLPEVNGTQEQISAALPACSDPIDGSGTIVGIVDYGCDFSHGDFLTADGTSRVLFLWDQRGGPNTRSPSGFGYGREFSGVRLNQALQSGNPFSDLSYNPGVSSHGTHVMGIAAGNGRATGFPGVAPNANIIFVHVSSGDVDDDDSFGNSRRLLEAVDYIFEKATELGRNCAVNISLGTHGGPHDGTTLAEEGFDTLLETPGRAIVQSAGNAFLRGIHAEGQLAQNAKRTLGWEIDQQDDTNNEIEVWYPGTGNFEVTLVTPNGIRLGPVPLDRTIRITRAGTTVGRMIHRASDPNNGDNQIDILLDSSLFSDFHGVWEVELHNVGDRTSNFHAWIERDNNAPSRFVDEDDDRSHTIGSISTARNTIAVGSYDAELGHKPLSGFTAEGPTRDGRQKPEVSAPGHRIRAARSGSQGTTTKSGTSMASPHVAGLAALIMQASQQVLTIEDIRRVLFETVRRNPPQGSVWHPRYGNGRIDVVASILRMFPAGGSPSGSATSVADPTTAGANISIQDLIASVTSSGLPAGTKVRINVEIESVAR